MSFRKMVGANDIDKAIKLFGKALLKHEADDAPVKWNNYVRGSIAFLRRDKETLIECREKIAAS